MTDEVFEKAYAKLNISLDIVGKLPDGYHAMDMVFQSVSLCDDVIIRKTEKRAGKCSFAISKRKTREY